MFILPASHGQGKLCRWTRPRLALPEDPVPTSISPFWLLVIWTKYLIIEFHVLFYKQHPRLKIICIKIRLIHLSLDRDKLTARKFIEKIRFWSHILQKEKSFSKSFRNPRKSMNRITRMLNYSFNRAAFENNPALGKGTSTPWRSCIKFPWRKKQRA